VVFGAEAGVAGLVAAETHKVTHREMAATTAIESQGRCAFRNIERSTPRDYLGAQRTGKGMAAGTLERLQGRVGSCLHRKVDG
jgi:hypothetical protein